MRFGVTPCGLSCGAALGVGMGEERLLEGAEDKVHVTACDVCVGVVKQVWLVGGLDSVN